MKTETDRNNQADNTYSLYFFLIHGKHPLGGLVLNTPPAFLPAPTLQGWVWPGGAVDAFW